MRKKHTNVKHVLVIGAGYVGLSYACMLAQKNKVNINEIDKEKIRKLKKYENPYHEKSLGSFLSKYKNNISINSDGLDIEYDLILLCLPTNYDEHTNYFNTKSLEQELEKLSNKNVKATVIIKSTVPVGFTRKAINKYKDLKIIFSPEFLKEGTALEDALNPSRIICGGDETHCQMFLDCLTSCQKNKCQIFAMSTDEAESVKLFSNTYLAMRVAFFNELDTYCLKRNISTNSIIKGVSSDPRIGDYYNNPSFGYGGYCLPKDTKQLLSNFEDIPQNLISSIVQTNFTRKKFISDLVLSKGKNNIGIYRLLMKNGSDNFRDSSILGIMEDLIKSGKKLTIFEPNIEETSFYGCVVENDFFKFSQASDLIIANRLDDRLNPVKKKVFTRDIFNRD